VEAAVLLPTLMLLLSMLVQPVCMGYTRMIMAHAAAETLRVMATSPDEATARNYALRRLRAVPEASLFHAGADRDWQIQVGREDEGRVAVASIAGHVRPLPFFGILASAFGERDGQGVVLRVQVRGNVRPAWVGGDYGEWQEMWD
jgi:hypothetical protein